MPIPDNPGNLVIALTCSGGRASTWSALAEVLGKSYVLKAPEHYGGEWNRWCGTRSFTLRDEAERTLALIDASPNFRVHLVGHSYGGAVALHVALARRERVASLSLYEPSAFRLLQAAQSRRGRFAAAEIDALAGTVNHAILSGDVTDAMGTFVDYWNAPGAWAALHEAAKTRLLQWDPKCPLEFHALLSDTAEQSDFAMLGIPTLILCGEETRYPSRLLCEILDTCMPRAGLAFIPGAGHMGPATHAQAIYERMAAHIANVEGQGLTVYLQGFGSKKHLFAGFEGRSCV